MPTWPGRPAAARLRLEATEHIRRSHATSTTGRTTRLIRSRSTEASGGIHQEHSRCHRSTSLPQSTAAGTASVGRGTSMAAACSLGGEAPCSEPQTHAPHPQSHTAVYGFFFAASFALFAAPAPSAHSRTHTHTRTHTNTHTYIHASTHTYKRMQALVDALSSTDPDDSAVERGGVPRALPLMTCPPLHLDFCFPV